MARNAPPKAATETCALVNTREYSSASVAAMTSADQGSMRAMIATITSGKTIRMPKTAMAIPQVRKRRRHSGLISLSTVALTTALSKDSEISKIASTLTMNNVDKAPTMVCSACQPR